MFQCLLRSSIWITFHIGKCEGKGTHTNTQKNKTHTNTGKIACCNGDDGSNGSSNDNDNSDDDDDDSQRWNVSEGTEGADTHIVFLTSHCYSQLALSLFYFRAVLFFLFAIWSGRDSTIWRRNKWMCDELRQFDRHFQWDTTLSSPLYCWAQFFLISSIVFRFSLIQCAFYTFYFTHITTCACTLISLETSKVWNDRGK